MLYEFIKCKKKFAYKHACRYLHRFNVDKKPLCKRMHNYGYLPSSKAHSCTETPPLSAAATNFTLF